MSQPFVGEIRPFGNNFAPRGWALCNGQIMSINQNQALFSLLGTTYGGDGITTFALPNYQGRVPVGMGQGPGLSNRVIGEVGGSESVTLTQSQIPQHTHPIRAMSGPGTQASPLNAVWAAGQPQYSAGTPAAPLNTQASGNSGGSQPHQNMTPFLCVTFAIALQGLFPSRN